MFGVGVSPGQPENILEAALANGLAEVREGTDWEEWNALDRFKWRGR